MASPAYSKTSEPHPPTTSAGVGQQEIEDALPSAESRRLQKYLKPFVDGEWTSTLGGLLRVRQCDETGKFHVSPAAIQAPFPDGWSTFVLTSSPDGGCRVLQLVRPDGISWKLEAWESHAGSRAVWSAPAGCSPSISREIWKCKLKEVDAPPRVMEEGEAELQAGLLAMRRELFQEAVQCFSAVMARHGSRTFAALRNRAKAQMSLGNLREATIDAQLAVEREPLCLDSHFTLGLVRSCANDFLGARESYRKALELSPGLACLLKGLWEAEQMLLTANPLPRTRRTFRPNEQLGLGQVWEIISRGAARDTPLRQVAMVFQSPRSDCQMPYLLTVPSAVVSGEAIREEQSNPAVTPRLYPLALYLHSAAFTDICKGDVLSRQLQLLTEEAPQSLLAEKGLGGIADEVIGLAPCCPSNVGQLDPFVGKNMKRRKIFWFKICEALAYSAWHFEDSQRCLEVELLTVELLRAVCAELPVDPQRIYFLGSSCGGYAVLRLAELVPDLPAAVVPFAGYYPDMPGQDHDTAELARRLRGVNIWPLHCKEDRLCKLDLPMVSNLYRVLADENGVDVEWVPNSVAKGSQSNYHSAYNVLLKDPEAFFRKLLGFCRKDTQAPVPYLEQRVGELAACEGLHKLPYPLYSERGLPQESADRHLTPEPFM